MNFLKTLPALLFAFAASLATAQQKQSEIDQQIAAFIESAPEQYYEQRMIMEKDVAPFLDTLDSPQLRHLCQKSDPDIRLWSRITRHAAKRIGKLEGEPGIAFFQNNSRERLRTLFEPALVGWAAVNPEASVKWILKHRGEDQTLNHLVSNLRDHRKSLEAILALPGLQNTKARENGMSTLGWNLIRQSPQEAYEWFLELPEDDQVLVSSRFLPSLSVILPEKTARLLPGLKKTPTHKSWEIIGNWALTEPEVSFEWTASLSDQDLQHIGRCITLAIWADIDPLAAWIALLSLPADDVKPLLETRSLTYRSFLEIPPTLNIVGFHLGNKDRIHPALELPEVMVETPQPSRNSPRSCRS